jgi:hypothetical protein
MKLTAFVRVAAGLFLFILVSWVWYCVAADYSYGAVSGTYTLTLNGEVSTLILNKDRSFQQELSRDGKVERTQGSWRRLGESGVVFSKEFLKVSGQEVRPDGEADGKVRKKIGLFPSITLNPDPGGPVFRKKLFR